MFWYHRQKFLLQVTAAGLNFPLARHGQRMHWFSYWQELLFQNRKQLPQLLLLRFLLLFAV